MSKRFIVEKNPAKYSAGYTVRDTLFPDWTLGLFVKRAVANQIAKALNTKNAVAPSKERLYLMIEAEFNLGMTEIEVAKKFADQLGTMAYQIRTRPVE